MDNQNFDRFNDKPPKREHREDRFSERPRRFEDSKSREFSSDRPRGFGERFEHSDRRRVSHDGFQRGARRDFGSRSGPRAKVMDRRRFTDHAAFVKTATVRLDPDVAEYFKNEQAVNEALRELIALTKLVKKPESSEETTARLFEEKTQAAQETKSDCSVCDENSEVDSEQIIEKEDE